ncbi:hypothetical protein ACOSQ2_013968 [Xanthoceras sorbifolium]
MTPKFNFIVCSIKEANDIEELSIDELQKNEEEVSLLMACHVNKETQQNMWYLDTGCSNHMCGDKKVFSDLHESFRNTVKFCDNSTISENSTHIISNVLFVPDLKTNLLSVDHFRIFGCIAFAHILDEKRKKLDDKGEKCIFLSVSKQSKAYKLYNPKTKKIFISRDVVFDEEKFWPWNYNIVQQQIPVDLDGEKEGESQQHVKNHGNDSAMFEIFKKSMMVEFDMSDLGMMHYYLGIEVVKSAARIFISQKNYV